jgi:hypothetical protein
MAQNLKTPDGQDILEHRYIRMHLTYHDGQKTIMRTPALVESEDAQNIEWAYGYTAHKGAKLRALAMISWGIPQGKDEDEVLFDIQIPPELFDEEG